MYICVYIMRIDPHSEPCTNALGNLCIQSVHHRQRQMNDTNTYSGNMSGQCLLFLLALIHYRVNGVRYLTALRVLQDMDRLPIKVDGTTKIIRPGCSVHVIVYRVITGGG